jgi:hypothetical protein
MSGGSRAMPTNGVGKRTDWLNHKVTLAHAWGVAVPSVRLVAPDGRFLHRDTVRLTLIRADAWKGIPSEAEELARRVNLNLRSLSA